ncbi:hypothetical protein QQ045_002464 [Rhodiola kirilowii]
MLLDGVSHDLEGDYAESETRQLCYEEDRVERRSDDCSHTYEDKDIISFLVKECEEVEYSRSILTNSVGEGAEEVNHEGFQTPSTFLDKGSSTCLRCPSAPRKPKAKPLRKRKRDDDMERRNLRLEFENEVELVLRLLTSADPKLKKAHLVAAGDT